MRLCDLAELCPLRFACALARSLKLFDKRLMAPTKAKIQAEAKAELTLRKADAKAEAEGRGRGSR